MLASSLALLLIVYGVGCGAGLAHRRLRPRRPAARGGGLRRRLDRHRDRAVAADRRAERTFAGRAHDAARAADGGRGAADRGERTADRDAVGGASRRAAARARRAAAPPGHHRVGVADRARCRCFCCTPSRSGSGTCRCSTTTRSSTKPCTSVEHVCFFGTAALFWWGIAHGRYGRARLRRRRRLRLRDRGPWRRARRAADVFAARLVRAVSGRSPRRA